MPKILSVEFEWQFTLVSSAFLELSLVGQLLFLGTFFDHTVTFLVKKYLCFFFLFLLSPLPLGKKITMSF
jgi:hypothetical protein